jgi:hypothetical protein
LEKVPDDEAAVILARWRGSWRVASGLGTYTDALFTDMLAFSGDMHNKKQAIQTKMEAREARMGERPDADTEYITVAVAKCDHHTGAAALPRAGRDAVHRQCWFQESRWLAALAMSACPLATHHCAHVPAAPLAALADWQLTTRHCAMC